MAVSSVQSMKAPFGRRNRLVGNTLAVTAGVAEGRNAAASADSLVAGVPCASNPAVIPATPDTGAVSDCPTNTAPASFRRTAICSGFGAGGVP